MRRREQGTAPSPELGRLLHALAEEPVPEPSPEREALREARMVEQIEAELHALVHARRAASRRWLSFAAAALVCVGVAFVALGRAKPVVVIQRETLPAASVGGSNVAAPQPEVTESLQAPPVSSAHRAEPGRGSKLAAPPAPSVQEPVIAEEATSSTLARENALFLKAAEAARSGDVDGALAQFGELARQHPSSPLAQTALVRRFRVLAKAARTEEARAEARRYLEAFPNGFAVTEARALLADSVDAGSTAGGEGP